MLIRSLVLALLAPTLAAQSFWHVDVSATPPGFGTPIHPYASIQYAVLQNTTLSGDTLLVHPGTYSEQIRFFGKTLVLKSVAGASSTLISNPGAPFGPNAAVRLIDAESPGSRIEGFTIRSDHPYAGAFQTGAVHCVGTSLEIRDSVIENFLNHSFITELILLEQSASLELHGVRLAGSYSVVEIGGAITAWNSTLLIEDCTFERCVAQTCGAIYAYACDVQLARVHAVDCRTVGGSGGFMGMSGGRLEVVDSEFVHNESEEGHGGALSLWGVTAHVSRCRFDSNRSYEGGAIASKDTRLIVEDSTFVRNVAYSYIAMFGDGDGYALRSDGSATMLRCQIYWNGPTWVTHKSGSAVRGAFLDRCTLVDNYSLPDFSGSEARYSTLKNCIVWETTPNKFLLFNCTATYSDIAMDWPGVGNLRANPNFVDLAGGDFALTPLSPCIDAGDPNSPPDPDGTRAEMGAVPWTVDTTTYCTAKTSSAGCVPSLGWSGSPSLSANDLHLLATDVINNRSGLFFWSLASNSTPFRGGWLCVASPLTRTSLQSSSGTQSGTDCTGRWDLHFDAVAALGAGLASGDTVYGQYWGRDPGFAAPNDVLLSDAIRFRLTP